VERRRGGPCGALSERTGISRYKYAPLADGSNSFGRSGSCLLLFAWEKLLGARWEGDGGIARTGASMLELHFKAERTQLFDRERPYPLKKDPRSDERRRESRRPRWTPALTNAFQGAGQVGQGAPTIGTGAAGTAIGPAGTAGPHPHGDG
jgi:hypothetical protein